MYPQNESSLKKMYFKINREVVGGSLILYLPLPESFSHTYVLECRAELDFYNYYKSQVVIAVQ